MTDPRIEADPDGTGEVLWATMSVIPPEKLSALAESDRSIARHAGRSETHDPSTSIDTGAVPVSVDEDDHNTITKCTNLVIPTSACPHPPY